MFKRKIEVGLGPRRNETFTNETVLTDEEQAAAMKAMLNFAVMQVVKGVGIVVATRTAAKIIENRLS